MIRAAPAPGGGPYFTWDDRDDRVLILCGPQVVAERLGLQDLREDRPIVVFDELHKYAKWKTFLKGLFDRHADQARVVVTRVQELVRITVLAGLLTRQAGHRYQRLYGVFSAQAASGDGVRSDLRLDRTTALRFTAVAWVP